MQNVCNSNFWLDNSSWPPDVFPIKLSFLLVFLTYPQQEHSPPCWHAPRAQVRLQPASPWALPTCDWGIVCHNRKSWQQHHYLGKKPLGPLRASSGARPQRWSPPRCRRCHATPGPSAGHWAARSAGPCRSPTWSYGRPPCSMCGVCGVSKTVL